MPHISDIQNFGDTLCCMKQLTGAEYKDMGKIWLPAFAPLLKGRPNYFKFIKAVTDFISIGRYHSLT